uniref:F-box/LRR-repeat protein 7 n=1 Tax=Steinernema glaseri TaxID=37863 RepID=A0A1I7Z8R3_9BILA
MKLYAHFKGSECCAFMLQCDSFILYCDKSCGSLLCLGVIFRKCGITPSASSHFLHRFRIGERYLNRKFHVIPRTTMDAVPLTFVDSAVELFGQKTLYRLAGEVRHPLWKDVIDLHHRNRVYYEVVFRKTEDGIKLVFRNEEGERLISPIVQTIRKNRRFARIVEIRSPTRIWDVILCCKDESFGEAETYRLLEDVAPFICQSSCRFKEKVDSPYYTKVILTSLFKRAYLKEISIAYCGKIAYDFLKDQINSSPFLSKVEITGPNWPKSSLGLLTKFCLKERRVVAAVDCEHLVIGCSHIQDLLSQSKAKRYLSFVLSCSEEMRDEKELIELLDKAEVCKVHTSLRVFKSEIEKFALFNYGFLLQGLTCKCGLLRMRLQENSI